MTSIRLRQLLLASPSTEKTHRGFRDAELDDPITTASWPARDRTSDRAAVMGAMARALARAPRVLLAHAQLHAGDRFPE